MATVPNGLSPNVQRPLVGPNKKSDLRHERLSAFAILAILIAIIAIFAWLASAGSEPPPNVEDYMPFML